MSQQRQLVCNSNFMWMCPCSRELQDAAWLIVISAPPPPLLTGGQGFIVVNKGDFCCHSHFLFSSLGDLFTMLAEVRDRKRWKQFQPVRLWIWGSAVEPLEEFCLMQNWCGHPISATLHWDSIRASQAQISLHHLSL